MTEISRSALFGRLNPTALKAIETATGFCKMRGNPYVELVHWLHVMLQDPQNFSDQLDVTNQVIAALR